MIPSRIRPLQRRRYLKAHGLRAIDLIVTNTCAEMLDAGYVGILAIRDGTLYIDELRRDGDRKSVAP